MRKPYFKKPLPAGHQMTVGTRVLANEIVTAFIGDSTADPSCQTCNGSGWIDTPDTDEGTSLCPDCCNGSDISAGLFGPKLSALIVELSELKEKADLFDMLEEALGHESNGTEMVLSISRDPQDKIVRIGQTRIADRQVFRSGGKSLLEAARTMGLSHPYDEEL